MGRYYAYTNVNILGVKPQATWVNMYIKINKINQWIIMKSMQDNKIYVIAF